MAHETKLVVATAARWAAPGVAFGLTLALSGSPWIAVAVAVLVAVVAGALLRRGLGALADDQVVAAGEHAVHGRIDAVEVFWRPGCPFFNGLDRELDAAGVPTNLRNIRERPADAAIVRAIAGGNETVPTLIIGTVALVNPSARLVMATLREHAPHLIDAAG